MNKLTPTIISASAIANDKARVLTARARISTNFEALTFDSIEVELLARDKEQRKVIKKLRK